MKLQQLLLDELEKSKENTGLIIQGEKYDNDVYNSMKAFLDLFTGEITHEYTCTSCTTIFQNSSSGEESSLSTIVRRCRRRRHNP